MLSALECEASDLCAVLIIDALCGPTTCSDPVGIVDSLKNLIYGSWDLASVGQHAHQM